MQTLNSSGYAWEPTSASASPASEAGGQRKLPTDVCVQIHGVFLVDVSNHDPCYTKCKDCGTKIDPITKLCKKSKEGCGSTPGDMTALSTIRMGDFSSGNVEMLADSDTLCQLAGVKDIAALQDLVEKTGASSLTFRRRFDVRIGANRIRQPRSGWKGDSQESGPAQAGGVSPSHMTPPRVGDQHARIWRNSTPLSASQSSPAGSQDTTVLSGQCDWQLLSAQEVLLGPWDSVKRPAVQKVFSHSSDTTQGQVLPVVSPSTEFVVTGMGSLHEKTNAKPDFVFTLCFCQKGEKPQIIQDPLKKDVVIVQHNKVYPYRGEKGVVNDPFAVEANCTLDEMWDFNMGDSKPRFIVGSLRHDSEGKMTLIAERIFQVEGNVETALKNFEEECKAVNELLSKFIELPCKRSAETLIIETPTKKSAKNLYDAQEK